MGIYERIISKTNNQAGYSATRSDHYITPANAMTLSRPVLAGIAANMLIAGETGVTPWVIAMGLSDAEGNVARAIDKYLPNSKRGSSTKGAKWDPIADSASLLTICAGGLFAPKIPLTGKLAIASVLGHEGIKAVWAARKNMVFLNATGQQLEIPPTLKGKESMAEKFTAVTLAVLSNDIDHEQTKQIIGLGSLGFALTGSIRGEAQRRIYAKKANDLIIEARKD
jgi:phosphatidylglycerophosphate synthase